MLLLVGCQTTTGIYKGAKADPADILFLLDNKAVSSTWHDLYLALDYSVKRQGEELLMEGAWGFAEHSQMMFSTVRNFEVTLYLLDQEHRVLDYQLLSRGLGKRLQDRTIFSKRLVLPHGAVAASIGYEGELIGEYGTSDWIWKAPKRD